MSNMSTVMGKVDFFSASRTMSTDVAEFFRVFLAKRKINLAYKNKVETLEISIANLDSLKGSIMEKNIEMLKASAYEQLKAFKNERDKLIDEQATYMSTNNDIAFKKALKPQKGQLGVSDDTLVKAIIDWFSNYGLDVADTMLLDEIISAIGSDIDINTMAKTEGQVVMKADSATKILRKIYGISYQHMVQVGTIKPAQIPELVREKYVPKKKVNKKNK